MTDRERCVVCDTTVGDIIVVYLKDDSPDFYCVDCVREINQFPFYVSGERENE